MSDEKVLQRLGFVKATKVVFSGIFTSEYYWERLILLIGVWFYIPLLALFGSEWVEVEERTRGKPLFGGL